MSREIIETLDTIQATVDAYKRDIREHADRIFALEQSGASMPGEGTTKSTGKLSDKVLKAFDENADLISKSAHVRLEVKAAGDALTTGDARSIMSVGVGVPAGAPLGVFNAMPQRVIGATSAVEYSRFLALEGAAAKQAGEGAAKAAVRPTFSLISQTAA